MSEGAALFRPTANPTYALAQIKAKNYAQKYIKDNKFVYLIGVEFSKTLKQIVAFEVERL